MIFLGLIGLIDPPRAEAAGAIEICRAAGIRPVTITGDHPNTGAAIAKEFGLLRSGRVVTGAGDAGELLSRADGEAALPALVPMRANEPDARLTWHLS